MAIVAIINGLMMPCMAVFSWRDLMLKDMKSISGSEIYPFSTMDLILKEYLGVSSCLNKYIVLCDMLLKTL